MTNETKFNKQNPRIRYYNAIHTPRDAQVIFILPQHNTFTQRCSSDLFACNTFFINGTYAYEIYWDSKKYETRWILYGKD